MSEKGKGGGGAGVGKGMIIGGWRLDVIEKREGEKQE